MSRQVPRRRPPRRGRTAAIAGACVLVVGGAAGVVVFDEDANHGAWVNGAGAGSSGARDDPEATTAGLSPDAAPVDVFGHASARLDDAGTFSYEASTRVEGSDERSAFGAIVLDSNLVGDVVLPSSVRETVDDAQGRQSERIAVGTGAAARVWRRQTAFAGQLDARPWGEDEAWPGELDPYRMPEWLDDVTDARDGGEDSNGRRVVHGNIPVAVVGEDGPDFEVISSTVELTVTEEGDPRRVLVEVATRDVVIEADYSLADLGGDVAVEPPPPGELDATPWFHEEDLAAFEGPAPVGLNPVPDSWQVVVAAVVPDPRRECAGVAVGYQEVDDEQRSLLLQTFPASCASQPVGETITVAGFSGAIAEQEDGTWGGVLTSGDTAVEFLTNLTGGDLEFILSTLGPLDLEATASAPPADA